MEYIKIEQDSILYSPDVVQKQRYGVFLLIDPSSPNWISVNRISSALIRACDGRHTLAEISERIRAETGACQDSINSFVNSAAEAGFISAGPDLRPAYTGRFSAIRPATLEELWINTNNSCLLNCVHCLVDGGSEPLVPLTTVEIENLVGDAVKLGALRIYFTGGEPLLRKDLVHLIDFTTQRAQLIILTSGVLVSDELAEQLRTVSHGNLLIQVSLDGPDASTNDLIRGRGSFDLAVKGIRHLINAGFSPIVTTTLTALNYSRAAETTRFLVSLGVRDHHILWLHGRGRMRTNTQNLLIDGKAISETMRELKEAASGMNIIVDNNESLAVRIRGRRGRKNDLCNSGFGILSVNTDGHVYPCAALCGADGFDCGSIKEQPLRGIWQEAETLKWIRSNSVQKKVGCSSCFLKYFCGGGCYAQSYFNYEMTKGEGCIMAPDPYCEAYKSQIMDTMWQMAMPDENEKQENRPVIYRHMVNELPSCAIPSNNVLDAAFDVGTYHCSCVLAMDVR